MFRKLGKTQSSRKKADSSEEEDDTILIIRPKKPSKSRVFTSRPTVKTTSRPTVNSRKTGTLIDEETHSNHVSTTEYTQEYLEQLRAQQPKRSNLESLESTEMELDSPQMPMERDPREPRRESHIPDADAIFRARKQREARRLEGDIVIETTVSKKYGESRLVTEEQEIEGEEIFEDHKGYTIAFGAKDRADYANDTKLELQQTLESDQEEEDEEENRAWENLQISHGHGVPVQEEIVTSYSIPKMETLPSVQDIVSEVASSLFQLNALHSEHTQQISNLEAENVDSTRHIASLSSQKNSAIQKYEFYSRTTDFILNLDGFLDEKFPILERLEEGMNKKQTYKAAIQTRGFVDLLESLLDSFTSKNTRESHFDSDLEDEDNLEDIEDQMEALLNDVDPHFASLHPVTVQFENWRKSYRKEYQKAYVDLSLPAAFELYIRHEMLTWNPFESVVQFETMAWHDTLLGYGHQEGEYVNPDSLQDHLLVDVIEKVCIPRLSSMAKGYNPFARDCTLSLLQALSQLLDYTTPKSKPFVELLECFLKPIHKLIHRGIKLVSHRGSLDVHLASRSEFLEISLRWMDNLSLWKKFLDPITMQGLLITLFVNQIILPILNLSSSLADISVYQTILDLLPGDWIDSNSYHPPTILLPLLHCFESNMMPKLMQEVVAKSILNDANAVLTKIKAYSLASTLAKKHAISSSQSPYYLMTTQGK